MRPGWLAKVVWEHEVSGDEGLFRYGRAGADHVGEWDRLVVRTDPNGALRALWTRDDVAPGAVEKLKRSLVLAFARAVRGELSWHAASVAFEKKAVLILGDSGAGKSTAAYALCREHGAALLADDISAVSAAASDVTVEPTEQAVWLFAAGGPAPAKEPRAARAATGPAFLATCAFLTFDGSRGLRARRLVGAESFERLANSMVRFIPSPEGWRRELDVIAAIASQTQCFEVTRGKETSTAATAEYLSTLARADRHSGYPVEAPVEDV